MAKMFAVTLPLTGKICIEVEADNEEDAITKALASDELTIDNIETWEAVKQICQGNFFHGMMNEADAELRDYDEDGDE